MKETLQRKSEFNSLFCSNLDIQSFKNFVNLRVSLSLIHFERMKIKSIRPTN